VCWFSQVIPIAAKRTAQAAYKGFGSVAAENANRSLGLSGTWAAQRVAVRVGGEVDIDVLFGAAGLGISRRMQELLVRAAASGQPRLNGKVRVACVMASRMAS
jgi:hypothetical protein